MRFVFLIVMLCSQQAGGESFRALKKELARQHFSGVLNGNVRFTPLGRLACGGDTVEVFVYRWEGASSPGAAVHSSQRVILMHGATYLGPYAVADKPTIQRDELRFPYKEYGNSIKCGKEGPPKDVLLDGENVTLAK
jgi:hypothetical protein